jgi:dienelactone hydrolase
MKPWTPKHGLSQRAVGADISLNLDRQQSLAVSLWGRYFSVQRRGLKVIKHLVFIVAGVAVSGLAPDVGPSAAAAQSPAGMDAALRFGAREGVQSVSLSPDGKSLAFIAPDKGRGNILYTVRIGTDDPPTPAIATSGKPERLRYCGWVANDRLLCNIVIVQRNAGEPVTMSRMIAIDSTGRNVKLISKRQGADALGTAYHGGNVIDWLPGADGNVLVARVYVPEERTGSIIASRDQGYGADRVDTRTLEAKQVERPRPETVEYISDGAGNIRIMGVNPTSSSGYSTRQVKYLYRRPGSKEWESLSTYDVLTGQGFNPYAVDGKLNAAYGFKKSAGLQGLYKVSLDGTPVETPVFNHPEVDVDGLVRIGRSRRVVGATFATDRRQSVYFDAELQKLGNSLSKALPGAPLIQFVGASEDETKLLIWAGSDTDPGRFYLLDRATRKMGPLMPSRPELEGVKLASVKPVTFAAADGTRIPGYLTLPPGSTGKNLPALVMPHGGPGARDEWGFDWLAQYFAHRGYAVLQPNFRGSSGYGDAWFQKNGFQSWRTAIGDVSDGGRWLVAQGIADPARLAILGWSYGGYAALQSAAVAPDLFKAVVAIAPVTDLDQLRADAMKFTDGVIARDFIGSGPHVREGSPTQNATAIKAPVMLFQGTLDSNVPVSQSRLMKDKLADAGKGSELVIYPDLDHYLDDSTARADMLRRSDAFLRAALKM